MVLNLGSLHNSHDSRISCLGLSADGSALCTGSWDTNLKVSKLFLDISITFVVYVCLTLELLVNLHQILHILVLVFQKIFIVSEIWISVAN